MNRLREGRPDARRTIPIPLDYAPHDDTRLDVADFNGDGHPDLAGFDPSAAGATGVSIGLQPDGDASAGSGAGTAPGGYG